MESLCILFKALVRSRIEYGLISYGSSSKTRQKKLEAIQNDILRLITGAPKTTPIKEMQCELGIDPLSIRQHWLSGKYILRIEKQPEHPLYQRCYDLRRNPKAWKDQNTPSLKLATGHTILADVQLFKRREPGYRDQIQAPAPWKTLPINIGYFPMHKTAASQCPTEARALYNDLYHRHLIDTTTAFTDGSFNKQTGKTTCAISIPSYQIEETYTLTKGSSIFSAEAYGILKAMEAIHRQEELVTELSILTDSKSVLQSIENPGKGNHPIVNEIISTAETMKSAGSKVNLYWIPAHIGIEGNEKADTLASEESSRPGIDKRIKNGLTSHEQESIYKEYLKKVNLDELRRDNLKANIHFRVRTGPIKWHQHKSRQAARVLFRLRTGHNRLNAHQNRFNPHIDPACSYCEEEEETTEHVLLKCPALEMERQAISQYLTKNKIGHTLPNLLGLNYDYNSTIQHEIQRLLIRYLKETRLFDKI